MTKKLYLLISTVCLSVAGVYLLCIFFTYPAAAQSESPVSVEVKTTNGQGFVIPDTYAEFDITIKNNTDQVISNVIVKNELDAGELEPIVVGSRVFSGTQQYQLTPERETSSLGKVNLIWLLEQLQPGQSLIIRYDAQVISQAGVRIIASAGVMSENNRTEAILLLPTPEIEISQTILGNQSIGSNGLIRFRLTLTNTSAITIPDVKVRHDLTGNTLLPIFTQITPARGSSLQPNNFEDFLIWNIGDIGPRDKWQITYDAIIEPFFEEGNEAVYSWATALFAETYLGQTERAQLPPGQALLELTREPVMKVDDIGTAIREEIRPGDTVQFTIHYANKGNLQAEQVVLLDHFDEVLFEEIHPGDITGSGYVDGARIRWDLSTLPAGESGTVSYTLTLKEDLSTYAPENEGNITAANLAQLLLGGQSMVNLSDQFTMRTPNLSLHISVNDLRVRHGESYRVTIEIFNTGSIRAENVQVIAAYDPTIGMVPSLPAGTVEEDGYIIWKNQMIPANDSMVYEYTFTVEKNTEMDSVRHEAKILLEGSERTLEEGSVRVAILPALRSNQIEDQTIFGILISLLIIGTLLVVGYQSQKLTQKKDLKAEQYQFYRDIIEILSVILIVTAVLLLGFTGDLGDSQALTVLSGIAGYVLGRRAAGVEHSPPTPVPSQQPSTSASEPEI